MVVESPVERAQAVLKKMGLARSRDFEQAGLSRTQIRRLLEISVIERVGRGLYRSSGASLSEHSDLAQAAVSVPGGVICLLTALRFHHLTTQNPFEVWLAIGPKVWRPRATHPPLRLVHLSGKSLSEGVEVHKADGVTLYVFSAAKTVADCFKFRNKIGTDVAIEALRAYRSAHPKGLEAVWRFAQVNRVTRVIQPYLEAVE